MSIKIGNYDKLGEAYQDMITRQEAKIALQAIYLRNLGVSRTEVLGRIQMEFPEHVALRGIVERVVRNVYASR